MPVYSFVCLNPNCLTNDARLNDEEIGFEGVLSYSDYDALPENENGRKYIDKCSYCEAYLKENPELVGEYEIGRAVRVMDITAFSINDYTKTSNQLKQRSLDDNKKNRKKYLEKLASGERNHSPYTGKGQELLAAKKGLKPVNG